MKNNIIYISFLLFLSSLCSCSLEEAYTPVNTEGTVEFVPRLTNYNDVNVTTKADADETAVYNSYLLLFNGEELISSTEDISSEGRAYSQKISTKVLGSLSSVTACYIANVPKTFVDNIKTASDLNTAVLDLEYPENSIGIPLLDHDNDDKTPSVLAIPMFGKQDITNLSAGAKPQINVTRLLAKVTLKIKMDLKDIGTLGRQRNTFFELLSLQLCNIPKKVYLSAPDKESTDFTKYETLWDITKDYAEPSTQIANQKKIYNQAATAINVSKDYSFDCYVPEYFLLPLNKENSALTDDQYGKQEYKPDLAGDKKAVYIKLIGNFDPAVGDPIDMEYDIYLGENSTTSFTLQRNKHYTNHVTITGIDKASAEVDNRVTITTDKDLINIYGEVANCYAISNTGEYTIKAYMGAYKYSQLKDAPKCTGTSVEIIAQDKAGVTFADSETPFVVSEEDGIKTIRFNVTDISADCNIVIAMMKDGAIEWSWHLWFIKGLSFGNQGFFELGTQDMPNSDGDKMVDRNLGVIREIDGDWIGGAATGFYYKYGHRAPYFEDKIKGNGKKYHGFAESDYSAWNETSKSVTDPCPPGYKVPSTDVWSGSSTKENAKLEIGGIGSQAFRYWNYNNINFLDDIYYPYSGYLDSNNVLQGDDASNGKDQNPLKNVKIPGNQNNTIIDRITTKPSYDPIVCTSIEYRTVDLDKGGYLMTSKSGDKNLLKYYFQEEGFELIKCTYYKGTWQQKGNKYTGYYYVANYTRDQKNNTTTKTGEKLKEEDSELYKAIMEGIKDETSGFLGGLFDDLAGYFNTKADISWDKVQSNYGYQVRCVKE